MHSPTPTVYRCGFALVSGVELFGLVLFGVGLDDGLVVLLLELELGDVALLELEGDVEFMSELDVLVLELPVVSLGEVVEDGELEVPL